MFCRFPFPLRLFTPTRPMDKNQNPPNYSKEIRQAIMLAVAEIENKHGVEVHQLTYRRRAGVEVLACTKAPKK